MKISIKNLFENKLKGHSEKYKIGKITLVKSII